MRKRNSRLDYKYKHTKRICGRKAANPFSVQLRFYSDGSGFSKKRGDTPDAESTELALLALCSQKNRRNSLVLRSPVTGSGSIDFSSSDEETDSSSETKTDSDVRTRMHSGLIGAILGGSGGIAVMLGVILWMKEKFGHHSDRFS